MPRPPRDIDPLVEQLPDDLKAACDHVIAVFESARFIDSLLRRGMAGLADTITSSAAEFRGHLGDAWVLLRPVLPRLAGGRGLRSYANANTTYPTAHQAALAVAEAVAQGIEDAGLSSDQDNPVPSVRMPVPDDESSCDPAFWRGQYDEALLDNGVLVKADDGFMAGPNWAGFTAAYMKLVPPFDPGTLTTDLQLEATAAAKEHGAGPSAQDNVPWAVRRGLGTP